MNAAFRLFGLIFFMTLYGCSTTGGTLGNLVPLPKFLKGKVENNIYYAKDGSFEIRVPYAQGSPAYTYMEVKEQYADVGAYVSFNSSVSPNEIYRIEVGKSINSSQPKPPFHDVVNGIIEGYKEQLKGYGNIPSENWRKETTLDGKKAILVTLIQDMPRATIFHIAYIVEASNGGAVVWVQWPATSGGCMACLEGTEEELMSTHERIKNFFTSFRLKI